MIASAGSSGLARACAPLRPARRSSGCVSPVMRTELGLSPGSGSCRNRSSAAHACRPQFQHCRPAGSAGLESSSPAIPDRPREIVRHPGTVSFSRIPDAGFAETTSGIQDRGKLPIALPRSISRAPQETVAGSRIQAYVATATESRFPDRRSSWNPE